MACAQSYGGGVTHSLAVWGIHHEEGVNFSLRTVMQTSRLIFLSQLRPWTEPTLCN